MNTPQWTVFGQLEGVGGGRSAPAVNPNKLFSCLKRGAQWALRIQRHGATQPQIRRVGAGARGAERVYPCLCRGVADDLPPAPAPCARHDVCLVKVRGETKLRCAHAGARQAMDVLERARRRHSGPTDAPSCCGQLDGFHVYILRAALAHAPQHGTIPAVVGQHVRCFGAIQSAKVVLPTGVRPRDKQREWRGDAGQRVAFGARRVYSEAVARRSPVALAP